jgi:hypothetical protein
MHAGWQREKNEQREEGGGGDERGSTSLSFFSLLSMLQLHSWYT